MAESQQQVEVIKYIGKARLMSGARMFRPDSVYAMDRDRAMDMFAKYPKRFRFLTADERKKLDPATVTNFTGNLGERRLDRPREPQVETPPAPIEAGATPKRKGGRPSKVELARRAQEAAHANDAAVEAGAVPVEADEEDTADEPDDTAGAQPL